MKNLLIVADNSFVAQSIRLALRQTAGFRVAGFIDGTAPISGAAVELAPDVVVIDDLSEPTMTLARLAELTEHLPETTKVLLTLRTEDGSAMAEALNAGVDAAISKLMHPVALATLLTEVCRGHIIQRFKVPEQTVKFHLSNTYRKLGVANRTEASRWLHQHPNAQPTMNGRMAA